MAWYSRWSGWDIAWGILTGGIQTMIKIGMQASEAAAEAERAAKDLEKLRNSVNTDITSLPWLKGASNTIATGKTQPYICGRHLFTPYILNGGGNNYKGFSTISGDTGSDQYMNVVLEGGFNKQIIEKIFCDDITLKTLGGPEPQEGKFYFDSNSVFASPDSFMEIAQDGQPFSTADFNKKIVEQQPNARLLKADAEDYEDLYFTLEQNSRAVDVCIMFNGLCHTTSAGVQGIKNRTVEPYFSLDYASILANGGDTSQATWRKFKFAHEEWIPTTKTQYTGVYTVSAETLGLDDVRNPWVWTTRDEVLAHIDDWTLTSGTDIRDSYQSIQQESHYTRHVLGHSEYNTLDFVTIVLKKEIVTEGHFGPVILSNDFAANVQRQIRFNAHVDFDAWVDDNGVTHDLTDDVLALENPITIKITTPDNEAEDGTDTDDTYIEWIHSYCYDKRQSIIAGEFIDEKIIGDREASVSTLIGLHIQATKANEDKLKSIQIITNGIAPIWDGEDWTTDKYATSNPASWLLEILTSDTHKASKMSLTEFDLDSFGAWYEYCESRWKFNHVFTEGSTKQSVIEMILEAGHASMYRDCETGLFTIVIDHTKDEYTALFNEQNSISFNWTKDLKRVPDGIKVKYVNEQEDFREDSLVLMYDRYKTVGTETIDLWRYPEERSADSVITEITFNGITNYDQAMREALFRMKTARLRLKTVTVETGKEGYKYKPYDKVLVSHPTLKAGLGSAEIKSVITDSNNKVTGLVVDSALTLNLTDDFYVIIEMRTDSGNSFISAQIEGFNGRTTEIELITPLDNCPVKAGDLLSWGNSVETIAHDYMISAISQTETGYTLTLAEYDERIYDESEEIPFYEPRMTYGGKAAGELPDSVPGPTIDQVAEIVDTAVVDIQDTISDLANNPTVYTSITSGGIAVNDNDIATKTQKLAITFFARQGDSDLDFYFPMQKIRSLLPQGYSVEIDEANGNPHTLILSIAEGTIVTTESLRFFINFTAYKYDFNYGDSADDGYYDGTDGEYGVRTELDYETEYPVGFTVIGVQGGRYLGSVIAVTSDYITIKTGEQTVNNVTTDITVQKPVSELILGDYFVFTASSNITSTLVEEGHFYTSQIYQFLGISDSRVYMWGLDGMREHIGGSLTDVLSVANESLTSNNSDIVQFLDHLTANSIFVDRLVANTILANQIFANTAIINDIFANDIKATGSIRVGDRYNAAGTVEDNTKTGAWLGNSGVLKAHNAELTNVSANGGTFTNIDAVGGNFSNITVTGVVSAQKLNITKSAAGTNFQLQTFFRDYLESEYYQGSRKGKKNSAGTKFTAAYIGSSWNCPFQGKVTVRLNNQEYISCPVSVSEAKVYVVRSRFNNLVWRSYSQMTHTKIAEGTLSLYSSSANTYTIDTARNLTVDVSVDDYITVFVEFVFEAEQAMTTANLAKVAEAISPNIDLLTGLYLDKDNYVLRNIQTYSPSVFIRALNFASQATGNGYGDLV